MEVWTICPWGSRFHAQNAEFFSRYARFQQRLAVGRRPDDVSRAFARENQVPSEVHIFETQVRDALRCANEGQDCDEAQHRGFLSLDMTFFVWTERGTGANTLTNNAVNEAARQ